MTEETKKEEKKDFDKTMEEAQEKREKLDAKEEQEVIKEDEELTDEEKALEREIERGYRVVEYRGRKFHIHRLTLSVRDQAAFEKAKEYTKLLNEGTLMPLKQLQEKLRQTGVWTDEQENQLEKTKQKYFDLLEKQQTEERKDRPNKAKLTDFKKKVHQAKMDFLEILSEKQMTEVNSLESFSDKIETYAKLALCVYEVNGDDEKRLWDAPTLSESIDKVRNEEDEVLFAYLNWHSDSFWSGYSPDFLGDWPEAIDGLVAGD